MNVSKYDIRQLHTMRNAIGEYSSGVINVSRLYIILESLWHLLDSNSPNDILPIDEINELEILNALSIENMIGVEELKISVKLIAQGIDDKLAQCIKMNE